MNERGRSGGKLSNTGGSSTLAMDALVDAIVAAAEAPALPELFARPGGTR